MDLTPADKAIADGIAAATAPRGGNLDLVEQAPRYRHDCGLCVYLGRHELADLYCCGTAAGLFTVLARNSGIPEDYESGLVGFAFLPALGEAYRRALQRGLVPQKLVSIDRGPAQPMTGNAFDLAIAGIEAGAQRVEVTRAVEHRQQVRERRA
jgi:hypothetical protein